MIYRTIEKTAQGYRIYGAFTFIMDVDKNGKVFYSNLKEGCQEYREMYRVYEMDAAISAADSR